MGSVMDRPRSSEPDKKDKAIRALISALNEYVVLGAGRCTIGKPAVEKARAAISQGYEATDG